MKIPTTTIILLEAEIALSWPGKHTSVFFWHLNNLFQPLPIGSYYAVKLLPVCFKAWDNLILSGDLTRYYWPIMGVTKMCMVIFRLTCVRSLGVDFLWPFSYSISFILKSYCLFICSSIEQTEFSLSRLHSWRGCPSDQSWSWHFVCTMYIHQYMIHKYDRHFPDL